MSYAENLWLFLLLLTGIVVVPGMDMIYVLASALSGGKRAGLAATAGMMAGGAIHTVFGTLGTGALVALVPQLFTPLLIAGAGYMIWIGVSLVRSSITVGAVETAAARRLSSTFGQALATCMLNPKAYLFVVAVYPQFLKPQYGSLLMQGVVMGLMTMAVQGVVYGSVALAGHGARHALVANPGVTKAIGRSAGLLLVAAAIFTLAHELR
ncbi:Lysine exporter protein (LYSE/YGGA) [Rhizobium sp. PDO1-076]|uniref:LysE family translocator n=1 Tax=Rhizobium sp. PDO1-076 TaxID=1125979 RepID=UPI00024E220B|nr:LysE family translocator [Rhizobium sp. PDO1-076]EHS50628.1 Lysine exporter protein (LYSE/YGGA) [Rhizobium sp. PDO1-076]